VSGTSESTATKLSEKWFEQRFSGEFGRYMNTRWTKTSTLDDPEDLAISALGTFQTLSLGIPVDREVETREAPVLKG
jgi:hypothetical protein